MQKENKRYSSLRISIELRKELGKRCKKEQSFEAYIWSILPKKNGVIEK